MQGNLPSGGPSCSHLAFARSAAVSGLNDLPACILTSTAATHLPYCPLVQVGHSPGAFPGTSRTAGASDGTVSLLGAPPDHTLQAAPTHSLPQSSMMPAADALHSLPVPEPQQASALAPAGVLSAASCLRLPCNFPCRAIYPPGDLHALTWLLPAALPSVG